jgi:hypothetical protein
MESDSARQGAALNILKKDKVDTSFFKHKITASEIMGTTPVRVDFDRLIKDVRAQAPSSYHLDADKPRYIPPADSLPKALTPEVKYVSMTDKEREDVFRNDKFLFGEKKESLPPPRRPTLADKAVSAKDIKVEILPVSPIIVPDDREPPPEKVDVVKEMNKPLAEGVEVSKGSTPEELTEVIEETKEVKSVKKEKKK